MQVPDSPCSTIPRIVIAALKGGAGKTLISVGIVAALRGRGLNVSVFKKGPDYIDAGWLGLAGGCSCYNLDAYLCSREQIVESFLGRSVGADVAIVEGNRGIFDGVDPEGSYSTAEMAKLLKAPAIVIVDATKMTGTAAAVVRGCQGLDRNLDLRGVILNRTGGSRHESVLREAVESACSIPVIGAVRKLSLPGFPQRHLGLLTLHEHPAALQCVNEAAKVVEDSIDLDRLMAIAGNAGALSLPAGAGAEIRPETVKSGTAEVRIGIVRDSAFQFYYPENLEALVRGGARLVEVSALDEEALPELHALYIGGGFPETHAERLAQNSAFKKSLQQAVAGGLPVYAECGGLMYLSRSLQIDENVYPMTGIFPIDTVLKRKPQGLGYIRVRVARPNPFYPLGAELTGHEFHYSAVEVLDSTGEVCAFRVVRGHGMDGFHDGICAGNALGTYLHIHSLGEPLWAQGLLSKAREFHAARLLARQPKISTFRETLSGPSSEEPLFPCRAKRT